MPMPATNDFGREPRLCVCKSHKEPTMRTRHGAALAAGLLVPALGAPATADQVVDDSLARGKFCSATAQAVARACDNQTQNDYWIAVGICINDAGRSRTRCPLHRRAR